MKYLKWLLICILLVGCTQTKKPSVDFDIKDYFGRWLGVSVSYSEEETYEIGYLRLQIEDEKHFYSFDIGAGNPGIKGTYTIVDDHTVRIDCSDDVDYDPEWNDLEPKADINFEIVDKDHLTFTKEINGKPHTLTFARAEREDD